MFMRFIEDGVKGFFSLFKIFGSLWVPLFGYWIADLFTNELGMGGFLQIATPALFGLMWAIFPDLFTRGMTYVSPTIWTAIVSYWVLGTHFEEGKVGMMFFAQAGFTLILLTAMSLLTFKILNMSKAQRKVFRKKLFKTNEQLKEKTGLIDEQHELTAEELKEAYNDETGIYLGSTADYQKLLSINPSKNFKAYADELAKGELIVVDPRKTGRDGGGADFSQAGKGKTMRIIVTCFIWDSSLIVADTKGEIRNVVAPHLNRIGSNVAYFDPEDVECAAIDSLAIIDPLSTKSTTLIKAMTENILPSPDGGSEGAYFIGMGQKIMGGTTGVHIYEEYVKDVELVISGCEKGFVIGDHRELVQDAEFMKWLRKGITSRFQTLPENHKLLNDWLSQAPEGSIKPEEEGFNNWLKSRPQRKTLKDVHKVATSGDDILDYVEKKKEELQKVSDYAASKGMREPAIVTYVNNTFSAIPTNLKEAGKNWETVKSSISQALSFMDDVAVSDLYCGMRKRIFFPEELLNGNTKVFVNFSAEVLASNPNSANLLYTMLTSSIMNDPKETMAANGHCLFLHDERPVNGNFPLTRQWLNLGRGKGLLYFTFGQTRENFDKECGEGSAALHIKGSKYVSFMGAGDDTDAEYLSKNSGEYEVFEDSYSVNTGTIGNKEQGPSSSTSSRQKKPVLSPSQITACPMFTGVMWVKGFSADAFMGRIAMPPYFLLPQFQAIAGDRRDFERLKDQEELYKDIQLQKFVHISDPYLAEKAVKDELNKKPEEFNGTVCPDCTKKGIFSSLTWNEKELCFVCSNCDCETMKFPLEIMYSEEAKKQIKVKEAQERFEANEKKKFITLYAGKVRPNAPCPKCKNGSLEANEDSGDYECINPKCDFAYPIAVVAEAQQRNKQRNRNIIKEVPSSPSPSPSPSPQKDQDMRDKLRKAMQNRPASLTNNVSKTQQKSNLLNSGFMED